MNIEIFARFNAVNDQEPSQNLEKAFEISGRLKPLALEKLRKELGLDYTDGRYVEDAVYGGRCKGVPDGFLGTDTIIKIATSEAAAECSTFLEAVRAGKLWYYQEVDGVVQIVREHYHYRKIQDLLHITNRRYCKFIVFAKNAFREWMETQVIEKDDVYWRTYREPQIDTRSRIEAPDPLEETEYEYAQDILELRNEE